MGRVEELVQYFTNRSGRKKRKRVLIKPIKLVSITQQVVDRVKSSVKEEKPPKSCHNKAVIGRKRTCKKSVSRLLKKWRPQKQK
jgi:hypothetical protein